MKEITAKTLPRVARAGVRLGRFWFKHNIDPILAAVLSVGVKKLVQKGARHLPRSVQPLFGVRQSRTPLLLCALGGGVAAAAVGGAAALSLLGSDTPPLERSLEGDRRFFSWRGHRIAYYVAGQGEPLLLVHSINAAASAHEMRLPFALLQRDFQVFAIDLIGFGASDRPALNYDADLYVALLTDFLRDVVPGPSHV